MIYSSMKPKCKRTEECSMAQKWKDLEESLCSSNDLKTEEGYFNLKQKLDDFQFGKNEAHNTKIKSKIC